MYASDFHRALTQAQGKIPHAIYVTIRREGIWREIERIRSGYADGPLLFDDLIHRIEDAIAPK